MQAGTPQGPRFFFRVYPLPKPSPVGEAFYRHEVTPRVVAIAVSIEITTCKMSFQESFDMVVWEISCLVD